MRFLTSRQLLRSVIAASLAVAGASTAFASIGFASTGFVSSGFASPASLNATLNDACFLNDKDPVFGNQRNYIGGPLECLLQQKLHDQRLARIDSKCVDDSASFRDLIDWQQLSSAKQAAFDFFQRYQAHQASQQEVAHNYYEDTILGADSVAKLDENTPLTVGDSSSASSARPSSEWFSHWLLERDLIGKDWNSTLVKWVASIEELERDQRSLVSKPAFNPTSGLAKRSFQPNLFVFSLETEPELESQSQPASVESSIASSKRPPVLQGDRVDGQQNVEVNSWDSDPHGIGHCLVPSASQQDPNAFEVITEIAGLGFASKSCESDEFSLITDVEVNPSDIGSDYRAKKIADAAQVPSPPSAAGLQARSIVEGWMDPNWSVVAWQSADRLPIHANDQLVPDAVVPPTVEKSLAHQSLDAAGSTLDAAGEEDANTASLTAESLSGFVPGDWSLDFLHGSLRSRILGESPMFKPFDFTHTVLESDAAVKIANEVPPSIEAQRLDLDLQPEASESSPSLADGQLDQWLASSVQHVTEQLLEAASGIQPAVDDAGRQATKLIAGQLKRLGEILIQSADRLDQVGGSVGVAGRSGTQR